MGMRLLGGRLLLSLSGSIENHSLTRVSCLARSVDLMVDLVGWRLVGSAMRDHLCTMVKKIATCVSVVCNPPSEFGVYIIHIYSHGFGSNLLHDSARHRCGCDCGCGWH